MSRPAGNNLDLRVIALNLGGLLHTNSYHYIHALSP